MRFFYSAFLAFVIMTGVTTHAQDIPTPNWAWVKAVEWNPNGSQIAFATLGGNLKVLDAKTGDVIIALEGETLSPIYALAWSPDGARLAITRGGNSADILDIVSGQVVHSLQGHGSSDSAVSLAWSPDGSQLATSSAGGYPNVNIWDVATEQILFSPIAGDVSSVAWSPDGTTLATSKFGEIRLWDVANQQYISSIDTPENVFTMAWSPDGRHIASSETYTAESSAVRIWDAATGQLFMALKGHTDTIMSVNWSPQGNILATTSRDKTVRIWDVASSKQLQMYQSDDIIFDASFSPFGGRLAVGITVPNNVSKIDIQGAVQTHADGAIQILVPAPSLALLQSIQAACVPINPAAALLTTGDLSTYIDAIKADTSIPPACAADLIAVAEALQAPPSSP